MNHDEIRARVLQELTKVAPEVDLATLDPATAFRDQVEFDSVDFLKLMTALEKRFGVTVGDTDFARLSSLDGCVRYLAHAAPARARRKK